MKEQYSHVILKMWYWNWDEDESVNKVVLLKNDSSLDDCVREVVTEYALLHNRSRPDIFVKDKHKLSVMMQEDIKKLTLSEQHLCEYTRHTMMNVLSYTSIRGDGRIEVMGLYTNTYELLGGEKETDNLRTDFKPPKLSFRPELQWINCNTDDMYIDGKHLVAGETWIHSANDFEYQLVSFNKDIVHIYHPDIRGYEVRDQLDTKRFLKEFKPKDFT